MRLASIRLQNFQCFKDSKDIPMYELTIFIGENDCGKTSILRSMDIFFNNSKISKDLFFRIDSNQKKNFIISCKFKIEENERPEYPKEYLCYDDENEYYYIEIKKIGLLNTLTNFSIIKRMIFDRFEFNMPQQLVADQLRALFEEIDELTYGSGRTARTEARNDLTEYIQSNFENLPGTLKWYKINWNEIYRYLPKFEAYESTEYDNPTRLISKTLTDLYKSNFYCFVDYP